MLQELEIRDFALIEKLRVPFSVGLNVLTGETGAGKSIIIDALNAVLGGKVGASIIRPGGERASAEATFSLTPEITAWLKQNELFDEGFDGLVISREITKSGSKARVNGTLVSQSALQELRQRLVTIHAQHEARTLQSSQAQLDMLDALADDQHKKALMQVRTLYARKKELTAQIAEINISEEERNRRLDFARFQLSELQEADLNEADEDEKIAAQVRMLANVVELEAAVATVQNLLVDGDGETVPSAIDLLQQAVVALTTAANLDATLEPISEALNSCIETLEHEQRSLRKYRDRLDTDPETLAAMESRLAQIATIKRKYGPTIAEAIARQRSLEDEIGRLETSQLASDQLHEEHDKVVVQLTKAAKELSAKRKELAEKLAAKIQSELSDLGMTHCRFQISLGDNVDEVGPNGLDRAEFLIAPNPGQPLLPVGKIASGGELSRVMLAVKSIFAHADNVSTVIFDEIETGLSGKVLQTMRDKLAMLARSHQILCITHQPLIASVADNHIQVSKQQTATQTTVSATVLSNSERLKSIAGMASGQDDQAEALKFAEALFADSAKLRSSMPRV